MARCQSWRCFFVSHWHLGAIVKPQNWLRSPRKSQGLSLQHLSYDSSFGLWVMWYFIEKCITYFVFLPFSASNRRSSLRETIELRTFNHVAAPGTYQCVLRCLGKGCGPPHASLLSFSLRWLPQATVIPPFFSFPLNCGIPHNCLYLLRHSCWHSYWCRAGTLICACFPSLT